MIKKKDSIKMIEISKDNKDKIGPKDLMNKKDKFIKIDRSMDRINNLCRIDKINQNGNNFK